MNKKQLIQVVADKMAETQSAAERYVNAFVDGVKKGILEDGHVQLVGFGAFEVKTRAPRRGRNPQTGELMQIKGGKTVTFRCGKPTKGEL